MSKRIGAIWMLLVALLVLTRVAYANSSDKIIETKWDEVIAQFNLRPVAELPPGIHPLEVSSPAKFVDLIQQLRRISQRRQSFVITWSPSLRESETDRLLTKAIETYVPLHKQECIDWVYHVFFNLWANVWVAGSGSFWEITDAHQWVGLTGSVTTFYSLSDEYSYHHISSDRQSVYIYGRATVDYYLFIKGLIKIYSFPVSLSITFNIK